MGNTDDLSEFIKSLPVETRERNADVLGLKLSQECPLCATPRHFRIKTAIQHPEADLQWQAIEALHINGYIVCEFRKARVKKQGIDVYRTPFGADGAGMTDLLAVRPPRVLFIECKSDVGILSPAQRVWRGLLKACPGVEYIKLKPKNWNEFVRMIC